MDVFFDDFLIKHRHSPLIQVDDYYPGVYPAIFSGRMGIEELAGVRSGELGNGFLYNGKELEKGAGLEWYDYGARFYDASLERFGTIDLLADNYRFQSPFAYAANNPVKFVDVFGLGPGDENPIIALLDVIADDWKEVKKNISETLQKGEDLLNSLKSDKPADFSTDDSLGENVGGTEIVLKDKGDEKFTEGSGIKGSANTDITELDSDMKVSTGKDVKSVAKNGVRVGSAIKEFFTGRIGEGDTATSYYAKTWTDNKLIERKGIRHIYPGDTGTYDSENKTWIYHK